MSVPLGAASVAEVGTDSVSEVVVAPLSDGSPITVVELDAVPRLDVTLLEEDITVERLDVELFPTAGSVGKLDTVVFVVLVAAVGKTEVMLTVLVQTPVPVPTGVV